MLTKPEFYAKLEVFIKVLEDARNADYKRRFGTVGDAKIGYDDGGARFVRVWTFNGTQHSVCYFVEKESGVIFGSKGWKAYNPNHEYGTLDTLDDYEWGGYYATRKDGVSTLVPKANRR